MVERVGKDSVEMTQLGPASMSESESEDSDESDESDDDSSDSGKSDLANIYDSIEADDDSLDKAVLIYLLLEPSAKYAQYAKKWFSRRDRKKKKLRAEMRKRIMNSKFNKGSTSEDSKPDTSDGEKKRRTLCLLVQHLTSKGNTPTEIKAKLDGLLKTSSPSLAMIELWAVEHFKTYEDHIYAKNKTTT